ncbi:3-deoxy-manno-octulosonate cytidylyltransferase [Parvularcula sp. LCG005]|uniref:3-deoxy-manno-octulosonate cytidylyltransferase n=1 Tax=Parvularcula sp. LCG005 TaxID=3078805 RepID=UPI002943EE5D|nr:3-deoxy-manno-octulosonate cytidylyltransferase [Parvularcula sp. LCG005]WOI52724.1 3-deoxy-manno-octulosonate cytidylyltransferase [Parvularcula sp. LCG005]
MTHALIVIPARYGSTRLPAKPLLADTGKPLIQHTVEAASAVKGAEVVVATDDQRIVDAVTAFGARAVMTDPNHPSGTDRVAEAARDSKADIVVNVQGDEPEIEPENIAALIEAHARTQQTDRPAFASTLVCPFPDHANPDDPNTVKAVLSQPDPAGVRSALYFSRSRVPFPRSGDGAPFLHLGIYAFTPEGLQSFPSLNRTPLENTESLEQLRILEHGHRIAVAIVPRAAPGIDTRADYDAFVARYRSRN